MTYAKRRTHATAVPALLAALLLSACGSTVADHGDSGALGQATDQSLTTPADGSAQDGATGFGGTGSQPGGPTGGGSGSQLSGGASQPGGSTGGTGAGTTGGTAGSGSAPGGGASVAMGPGVTATTVSIGVPYCNDCAAANAAVGGGGEDPGDTRRYYKAVIDDVNAHGGVLGRKLVPVWHEISASDDIAASQQAACETFTKDHKVVAIFFRGEIIYECAKKAGIIAVGDSGSGPVFARYPNLFAPASIRLERLGAVTVNAMVKAGWHKPEPKWPTGKIGLITWNNNDYKYSMTKGWLPALHAAGLKETEVRYIAVPQSAGSIADAGPAISAAVLSFRQLGIDHVFISDGPAGIFTGTGLTLLFLQNAKSQNYYPRYGFNTYNSPGWENLPADQEVGMLAVDSGDTERINDEGIPLNPQRERCWNIMRKKGLPVGQVQTQNVAIGACGIAWFSEAILERSRSTLLADVIAGGEALGTSYRSASSYGNRLGPGQHDGTSLFRNSRFDEGCSCMRYTSKPYEP